MNIPKETLQKGSIIIYDDSDRKVISEINEYNTHMDHCRMKMKRIDEIYMAYTVLNPLVICSMIAGDAASIFTNPFLATIILTIYSTIFVTFALIKKNLLISTIAGATLLLLDWKFAILFVIDVVLYLILEHIKKPLIEQAEYPLFMDIHIRYGRGKRPHYGE